MRRGGGLVGTGRRGVAEMMGSVMSATCSRTVIYDHDRLYCWLLVQG